MSRRIGIDLDGVLIDHTANKIAAAARLGYTLEPWQTNTNVIREVMAPHDHALLHDEVYLKMTCEAPAIPGALEHLATLDGELYIVSARKLKAVRYAQQWLMTNGVFDIVPAERMFFCESRKDKRAICDRLGITAFVDDHLDVLQSLSPRMKRVLFDHHGVGPRIAVDEGCDVASDWSQVPSLVAAGK